MKLLCKHVYELGWWVAPARSVEECVAALERHGAGKVFVGRGAAGASLTELLGASQDLGVPVETYRDVAEIGA